MVSRCTEPVALCAIPSAMLEPELDHESALNLKEIIIESGCKVLAELSDAAGSSSDEKSPTGSDGIDRRRTILFTGSTEAFQNGFWLRKTRKVMKQLNAEVPCIPSTAKGAFRFLDLGCCPGGFSAYILEKNKLARSLGISLPTDVGGYAYCLDKRQRRETFLPFDITRFNLGLTDAEDGPMPGGPSASFKPIPREIKTRSFDLSILGATPLSWATLADSHRLLISQIVLGLEGTKSGGTLIVLLQTPESPVTARVLYLLDRISLKITVHKSSVVHQTRGSFYVVAQGLGEGKDGDLRDGYLASLKALWTELTLCGGREMVGEDLDFIVTIDELCRTGVAWLVELCAKVWEVQLRALEAAEYKDSSFSSLRELSFTSSSSLRDTSFSSL